MTPPHLPQLPIQCLNNSTIPSLITNFSYN